MNIIAYISTLVALAVIDSAWLFSMGSQYKKWLGHLFSENINFYPAVVFYLIYTAGVVFFVISPALKNGHSLWYVALAGALLGLFAYATYDLTNHATMRNWPLIVTVLDIVWGAILTGMVSVLVVFGIQYFK